MIAFAPITRGLKVELDALCIDRRFIGDVYAPRDVEAAILNGFEAAANR